MFPDEFLRDDSRQLLMFYGKTFCQQNSKEPSEKGEKMKTAWMKKNKSHIIKT